MEDEFAVPDEDEFALLEALEAAERSRGLGPPPPAPPALTHASWTCAVCCTPGQASAACSICGGAAPAGAQKLWALVPLPAPCVAPPPQQQQKSMRTFFAAAEPPEEEAMELPPVDERGLAECPLATPGVRIDPVAAQTFVFPAQTEQRAYQLAIVRTCLFHNTLVCLPTGLGKTLIAAVVMRNFSRWFPQNLIVFLAPTKPLVQQQAKACVQIAGIPETDMAVLMGTSQKGVDGTRAKAWSSHRAVFATPQTFDNDLKCGVLDPKSVVCLVVDEAHRATGSFAYVTAVKYLHEAGVRFRLVALTATPGATRDAIQKVVTALHIGAVEWRAEDDPEVLPFTHARTVDVRAIAPSLAQRDTFALLTAGFKPMLNELQSMGVVHHSPSEADGGDATLMASPYTFITARHKLSSQAELAARLGPGRVGRAHHLLNQAQSLARGLELLTTVGLRECLDYLQVSKTDTSNPNSAPLQEAFRVMRAAAAAGGAANAPKMEALTAILRQYFGRAREGGARARVIVFTSSRDSVNHILLEFAALEENVGVRARAFIGQGDSSSRVQRGDKTKGQTQAEQQAVLAAFREGIDVNVLVATCIGEEGLDVPQVDLVVFMDAVGGVRLVQRMGRTGRSRDGAVIALLAEGKEYQAWFSKQQMSAKVANILRNADATLQMSSDGVRMLPHRYKPRIQLVDMQLPPQQEAPPPRRGQQKRKMLTTGAASKKKGPANLLADLMAESDSEGAAEGTARVAGGPSRWLDGPDVLNDDDFEGDPGGGGDGGAAWGGCPDEILEEDLEMPAPPSPRYWHVDGNAPDVEIAPATHAAPEMALPIPALMGLVACAARWQRDANAVTLPVTSLMQSPHCPPRMLRDDSSVLLGLNGVVVMQPPTTPGTAPHVSQDSDAVAAAAPVQPEDVPMEAVQAVIVEAAGAAVPHGVSPAVAPLAAQPEIVDLTGLDDDDDDEVVVMFAEPLPEPPAPLAPPAAAMERDSVALADVPDPSPAARPASLSDDAVFAARLSMPPPPPRGRGSLSDASPVMDDGTPIPLALPLSLPPPLSSGPAVVLRAGRHVRGRGAAAAQPTLAPGDAGTGSQPVRRMKRRRLVRKASLEEEERRRDAAGGNSHDDNDDDSPAVRLPRRVAGRRAAGAGGRGGRPCAFLDDEAAESDSEERGAGGGGEGSDGDDEDEDEEDDSFVTGDTGDPTPSTGGPQGLALYRQFMVTPDSATAAAAGGFAQPAARPAAYRLADLKAVRSRHVIVDSPSLEGGDVDGDDDEEEDDDEGAPDDGRNDNVCRICRDGGQLLLCDGCPAAYHHTCLHLPSVPSGDWYCADCRALEALAGQFDDGGALPDAAAAPPSGAVAQDDTQAPLWGDGDYEAMYAEGGAGGTWQPPHESAGGGEDDDGEDAIESPDSSSSDGDSDAPNFDLGLGL